MSKLRGGQYFEFAPEGPVQVAPADPDVVCCRRLDDFDEAPPFGAAVGTCTLCGAKIVYNPNGPHTDKPRACFQCLGILPLPMGDE